MPFTPPPKNPFLHHAEIVPSVTLKDGLIVGCIAAIIDQNYINFHQEKTGFFGFFESIDDKKVARPSWILEDNRLMQKGLRALGARIYKTYRIYRVRLQSTMPRSPSRGTGLSRRRRPRRQYRSHSDISDRPWRR
jgi:hypothetical protein